ncbi:MAG: HD domain-containing protein [Hyphomicrobiaceae bacterium]
MTVGAFRKGLQRIAPTLLGEINTLVSAWLPAERLHGGFRPKQVNDPIWGTVELLPWEVALLDTPLLQRMRGVKQLGLAPLVFPSASHDRLEHQLGVVGATDKMILALSQQIERWNRENATRLLPAISKWDRYALRLAALLHDIGHGPFSHALEPVLEIDSVLVPEQSNGAASGWREELVLVQAEFKRRYRLNKVPAPSEILSALMILSDAMVALLGSDKVFTERDRSAEELAEFIVAAVVGGVEGPGASHLSAIISSQIDSDKLDYLARDAHHAGLEIGFDTDRLLSRLEVLRVTPENVDASAPELRARAQASSDGVFFQIGIAAAGFGSFEQMLIGRTFLYDRLYHHHKVRAAEAMAQRMMLVAERDRNKRFSLGEIFLKISDDTMLRVFAGEVAHRALPTGSPAAAALAQGILDRDLLHRAFAFRGRLISAPAGFSQENADSHRQFMWRRVVKSLSSLASRYEIGLEIHQLATRCAAALAQADVDRERMEAFVAALAKVGPEQIIVDLPELKAGAIQILARYPNGALKVPEFSFNPVKWSNAYELQKRTGYVFCPRSVLPIIALASRIVFLSRFGVVMSLEADGYIKSGKAVADPWLANLVQAGIIDALANDLLTSKRFSLIQVSPEDLRVPQGWLEVDPDLAVSLSNDINGALQGGLTAEHLLALGEVLASLFAFVDAWYDSGRVTQDLEDEAVLQSRIRDCFKHRGVKTSEGAVMSGGELDLHVADTVLVENKFHEGTRQPDNISRAAGMQGRRYAISLNTQLVVVLLGYKPTGGEFPSKSKAISVHKISADDARRVEIRVTVPYGAVRPSEEKADRSVR